MIVADKNKTKSIKEWRDERNLVTMKYSIEFLKMEERYVKFCYSMGIGHSVWACDHQKKLETEDRGRVEVVKINLLDANKMNLAQTKERYKKYLKWLGDGAEKPECYVWPSRNGDYRENTTRHHESNCICGICLWASGRLV